MVSCLHLSVLFWALTWARPAALRITSDTDLDATPIRASSLVMAKGYILTSVNSPDISVKRTVNNGLMIFKTDEDADAPLGRINYRFDGHFVNAHRFVVQHGNSHIPLHVSFANLYNQTWLVCGSCEVATNFGDMVFRSNGPVLHGEEFLLELPYTFVNDGGISVLGTTVHQPRMKMAVTPSPRWYCCDNALVPAMENTGTIFLHNAVLDQAADITDAGCIVIGEGGVFVANTAFEMDQQRIFFQPVSGQAELHIRAAGCKRSGFFYVNNFPKNSRISVDVDYEKVTYGNDWVKFYTMDDQGNVTVVFEGLNMDMAHFRLEGRTVTYVKDAINPNYHPYKCHNVHRRVERALAYEIKT